MNIFVDVDGTLVYENTTQPIKPVINKLRILYQQGHKLYCWSSGGEDYAERIANHLGIKHLFIAFIPKPHLLIDDQPFLSTKIIHPDEIETISDITTYQQPGRFKSWLTKLFSYLRLGSWAILAILGGPIVAIQVGNHLAETKNRALDWSCPKCQKQVAYKSTSCIYCQVKLKWVHD